MCFFVIDCTLTNIQLIFQCVLGRRALKPKKTLSQVGAADAADSFVLRKYIFVAKL